MEQKKYAERIRILRESQGLTQADLAAELTKVSADGKSVSREMVNLWENGSRDLKTSQMITLCKYFNVTADYLLGLSEIQSTDADMQTACKVTGLNPVSIEALQRFHGYEQIKQINILNLIFSDELFFEITLDVFNYVIAKKSSEYEKIKAASEQFSVEKDGGTHLKLGASGAATLYEYRIVENFKQILRNVAQDSSNDFEEIKKLNIIYTTMRGYLIPAEEYQKSEDEHNVKHHSEEE